MLAWLGKIVGKEAEDLSRHDKWLCMMYPRLRLLKEFLRGDGSIWINIDDNESHSLKLVCDEIFGRKNFIANIVWQSRYSRSNDAIVSLSHNHILVYANDIALWKLIRNRLLRTDHQAKQYTNSDNDPKGMWRAIPWDAPNIRENLSYPIKTASGKVRLPPAGRCWSRTEDQWLELVKQGRAYYGISGNGAPSFKQYISEASDIVPNTWWPHTEAGHTDEAKKEIAELFGSDNSFDTPKPERLLRRIIQIASNPTEFVLDSFAGSGTTGAVAHKMGRKHISVELGDHAQTHIVPRYRKVIGGSDQGGVSKAAEWLGGGGFRYCTLGEPLFDADGNVSSAVTYADLAAHVFFCETGSPIPHRANGATTLIGTFQGRAVYLLHASDSIGVASPHAGNVLTATMLGALPSPEPGFTGARIVYAEGCTVPDDRLNALGVTFKQIPYQIEGL